VLTLLDFSFLYAEAGVFADAKLTGHNLFEVSVNGDPNNNIHEHHHPWKPAWDPISLENDCRCN